MDLKARYRGCLLGLAVGDAVGTTLEFTTPGTFTPITDMVGGGPFNLEPGQWTDDTSMALCLATSLVEKQTFDATDQMNRYLSWWRHGTLSSTGHCFDIGNTTIAALSRYERNNDPYAGDTDPYSAGNGSIMRLAPIPMFYYKTPQLALTQAGQSSRTTHATQAAVDGCRYLAALIIGALTGAHKSTLLAAHYTPIPTYWQQHPLMPDMAAVAAGSFHHKQPPTIRGSGYVVESLEAALWAFAHSQTFAEGCLLAANLGDDADTTTAVYGQLAGAYYGITAIPTHWLAKLTMYAEIKSLADQLYDLALTNPQT